ncbi:ion channel [Bermanella sp. WJH001]|uniref:ion channel n=1 Tax=Bermanella sp. WJH001 TaxID=3048005 RepID=UPI0024BE1FC4|nr:ion channel [Bermanella sp. WJH001]MDJ1538279.1 ion channel [Bermanella sp. WJH001]
MCLYRFKDGNQCRLEDAGKGLCYWHDPTIKKNNEPLANQLSDLVKAGHSMEGACLAYANLDDVNLVSQRSENAYSLANADLFHASLHRAHLFKVDMSGASLMKADCSEANVHYANLEAANLLGAKFDGAKIENVHWGKTLFHEALGFEACAQKNQEKAVVYFEQAEEVARHLRKVSEHEGLFELAGHFFIKEMINRRRQMPRWSWQRLLSKAVDLFCGYGEQPARVVGFSLCLIFIFAIAFWVFGIEDGSHVIQFSLDASWQQNLLNLGNTLYFSVVTFTTLGYGDLVPIGFSRMLAAIEAFTGSFTLALFVVVFVKKMTR